MTQGTWRCCENMTRTREYVGADTHPFTWQYVAHHKRRTLIWRMRCGTLPLEAFVKKIGLPRTRHTAFDGRCACSGDNEVVEETVAHMLVEYPLYGDIRRRMRNHKHPTHRATPEREKMALGWVPEVTFPPDGALEQRMAAAKRAIEAAIVIWQRRNAIMSKLLKEQEEYMDEYDDIGDDDTDGLRTNNDEDENGDDLDVQQPQSDDE